MYCTNKKKLGFQVWEAQLSRAVCTPKGSALPTLLLGSEGRSSLNNSILRNGGWVQQHSTKLACDVKIATLINILSDHLISDVRLLTHPSHDQHYWAWSVDINGGWSDNGNLIAGGPMDLEEALIPS